MILTEEQRDVKRAAREFAEGEFRQRAREFDEKEEFDLSIWKKACECGFVGVFIKEEYGGPGLGFLEHCLITEEFWRVDPGCGQSVVSCTFGAEMIQLFGTEEQKRRYLPSLVRGDAIIAMAITEPDCGSDVAAVKTVARRHGDRYVINGTKMFITNGCNAHYILVFCLTDPEGRDIHRRHSVILVERERKGLETEKIKGKLGIRASNTAEIRLNEVEVPVANLIGRENNGFYQLMSFFNLTRLHIAAQGVGVAQGALDLALSYVKKRRAFGRSLSEFQGVQFKLAEMATRIEASRSLYYRAAMLVDRGEVNPALISMAKWFAGETGVSVANEALQLHGGYGFIADYDIQRFYRDAKIVEIYEGSKEIEKLIIARELLKSSLL
jgi:alkylation response protein AidB-like acyl-CoA dehydrogenase